MPLLRLLLPIAYSAIAYSTIASLIARIKGLGGEVHPCEEVAGLVGGAGVVGAAPVRHGLGQGRDQELGGALQPHRGELAQADPELPPAGQDRLLGEQGPDGLDEQRHQQRHV